MRRATLPIINLRITRRRLVLWGCWCRKIVAMGLNYSSVSLLGSFIDCQGVVVTSSEKKLTPDNEDAEEIEALILALGKINPQQAKILCIHYACNHLQQEKIIRSGCTKATYYRLLRKAESWVDKALHD